MSKFSWGMGACALFVLWAATAIALPAQIATVAPAVTFTTLHTFDDTDGADPGTTLVQGINGNLYGTTYGGGTTNDGTLFQITPQGALTTLHSFDSSDGVGPIGLTLATNGLLYGTTNFGGANGGGTVFSFNPSTNTLKTIYSFCTPSNCSLGSYPVAGVIQGADGNFYGTTQEGGNTACNPPSGCGTVFKINAAGTFNLLHTFGGADGAAPYAGLLQGANGKFYGTTAFGGNLSCNPPLGCGTVFEMAGTSPYALTTLHVFAGTDGAVPYAGVVQDAQGNFYGTTVYGGNLNCGTPNGCGTVFKMAGTTLTTLHSFDGTDGAYPEGGLLQATDGNFYGTTSGTPEAPNPCGTTGIGFGAAFAISTSGTLTPLHRFSNTDGAYPYAQLAQATNGILYGSTVCGGANGDGTVFSLSVGLGTFVETEPTFKGSRE